MRICFNLASRSRPARFFAVLENLRDMTLDKDYFVVFKGDEDDFEMWSQRGRLLQYPEVIKMWGHSKSKIHAINRDLNNLPEYDIICNLSDDQLFIERGFDRKIKEQMTNFDLFLHFSEPYSNSQASKVGGDEIAVMHIVGKDYFLRDNYIYYPGYYSLWCDNEATAVAKLRGCYKYIPEPIFAHYHYSQSDPSFRIKKDALYQRNDTYRQDERIFNERKKINFGLKPQEIVL